MTAQWFILKTEIHVLLAGTAKSMSLYIPALYSPDFPIRANNIEVFRSHKQIL